ncbi:TetR/AcrR family transcriptional regulator [Desulfovibrio inopinatus]|uniref:TetR/AcrR family transcriptional regulator n=1 Tax=Desulfovibrio inopinatus TaxID=102109 RepID=UPI0003FA5C1A|nr:TetR/AcrR family transcriptional regulator [Desulfovibrio inopinatus]
MQKRFETEVRREQIADAALSIIFNEGVSGVTVRKVAQKVGFSAPALYRHYKGKSDILLAVLEDHFSVLFVLMKEARQKENALEALKFFYFAYIDLVRAGRSALPIFISEHVRFKELKIADAIDEFHDAIRNIIIEILQEGQSATIIRNDISHEELFIHYIGLLITPDLLFSHHKPLDLSKQSQASWTLFSKAVST